MHIKSVKSLLITLACVFSLAACSSNSGNSDSGNNSDSDFPCSVAKVTIDNGEASQTLIDNYNSECQ